MPGTETSSVSPPGLRERLLGGRTKAEDTGLGSKKELRTSLAATGSRSWWESGVWTLQSLGQNSAPASDRCLQVPTGCPVGPSTRRVHDLFLPAGWALCRDLAGGQSGSAVARIGLARLRLLGSPPHLEGAAEEKSFDGACRKVAEAEAEGKELGSCAELH